MCFAHFFPAYLYVFKLSMIVELDTAEHFIFAAFFIVYFDTLHYQVLSKVTNKMKLIGVADTLCALEKFCCCCRCSISTIYKLSARHTGDARATAFLKQRLDMAIQRGNAAAVVGTLAEGNALQD